MNINTSVVILFERLSDNLRYTIPGAIITGSATYLALANRRKLAKYFKFKNKD